MSYNTSPQDLQKDNLIYSNTSSKKIKKYFELEEYIRKTKHLENVLSIIHWDGATYLPAKSAPSRHIELTTLASIIHQKQSSSELGELINSASQEKDSLDDWQKANLKNIKKIFDSNKIIPLKLNEEYVQLSNQCEFLWRSCRKNNDFKTLQPQLEKLFSKVREIASIKSDYFGVSKYDSLIDQYDPERSYSELNQIFKKTKSELPGLIEKIIDKQRNLDVLPISNVDIETQQKIERSVMEHMGFDFTRGRVDESVHPFCGGTKEDVRLTTKHKEEDFLFSLYAVIHETGHGLYEQHLPRKYVDQPVGEAYGMAFHESQSLLMEVQVGTSKAFCTFLSKLLRDKFNFQGRAYSAENLFNIKTRVKPSLIRIDADEVTYPFHVIIRAEIENGIVNGEYYAKDLPELWNQKYKEYLGVVPDNDSNGCMQDIHWPSGSLGYFPSYYAGSIISSMVMNNMRKNINHLDDKIVSGDFREVNHFLNKNLRELGRSKSPQDLLKSATNYEQVNADIFLSYVKEKYLETSFVA
jgi:carboxypeptidase Taq